MARSLEGKKLLAKLITATTGFQKEEENYEICKNFVNSNLRFHRYLDVDSHKVSQKLNGLYEKFRVHSKTGEGKILEDKVSQFLSTCDFEKKNTEKTETHYAILSFLLEMSNSPTTLDLDYPLVFASADEKPVEHFDWYTYLTEDLESLESQFSDSSSDSQEDEFMEKVTPSEDVKEPSPLKSTELSDEMELISSSLREQLVPTYWTGVQDPQLHIHTDLIHNWNCYLKSIGSCETSLQDTYMTEYQMVRELLWMLSGASSLFLFTFNADSSEYSLRPGVSLIHTTKNSLESLLGNFLKFGSKLAVLRSFSMNYLGYKYPSCTCRTYQAFCVALRSVVSDIDQFTVKTLRRIKDQEQAATLMSVTRLYEKHYQLVSTLHDIYSSSVSPILSVENPFMYIAASQLLSKCNMALNDICLYSRHQLVVNSLLKIFLRTIQPYLDIIDEWLSHGNLNDPHNEFVIRKKNVECLDETFWDTAVEMTTLDDTDSATDAFTFHQAVPAILEGTLNRIAITGKSMEMLSGLGKLNLALSEYEGDLHTVYLANVTSAINNHQTTDSIASPNDSSHKPSIAESDGSLTELLTADKSMPQLLLDNFRNLERDISYRPQSDSLSIFDNMEFSSMIHLSEIMSRSLAQLIDERFSHVSQCLLTVLMDDCRLLHYLNLVRKVYLLDAGDMMYDFTWELFDKVRHNEDWKDSLSLNLSLHECLEKSLHSDISRFGITLTEVRKSEFLPIHVLEHINLHFEVDWPVDVIYDSNSELDYNRIFQFLLQLKLSKYCLDNLKFVELTEKRFTAEGAHGNTNSNEDIEFLTQSVYLHRMKLLHVVNGLHDHIMTNIVQTAQLQFNKELANAKDLESILTAHKGFVSTIYDRCFLHENNSVVRDCILHILNLALVFQRMWDEGVHLFSKSDLQQQVNEFNRCLQVLISFISPLSRTGSLPHLEQLSLALRMSAVEELS